METALKLVTIRQEVHSRTRTFPKGRGDRGGSHLQGRYRPSDAFSMGDKRLA